MIDLWQLPDGAELLGERYPHKTDFRDVLKLFRLFGDERRPLMLRWYVALEYFYERPVPRHLEAKAMEYLSGFVTCGEPGRPGPKLLDWELDAAEIIADVNAVAGQEVRSMPYLHWWSFLSFFRSIRDGSLSQLVTIRQKLYRGQKLESYEQEYYLQNKNKVRLRPPESAEETAHKRSLEQLLNETPTEGSFT